MRQSETTAAFYKAFCSAQALVSGAVKDAENPHLRSKYADLAAVWAACKHGLTTAGIGVIQALEPVEGLGLCCVTRLVHGESGEWIESALPLIVLKQDMQGLGSAFTYAKRYALGGMVGVWTEDDDGEAASHQTSDTSKRRISDRREDGRRNVNEQFRTTVSTLDEVREKVPSKSQEPVKIETWPALLARRVREINSDWRNELGMENVPAANRADLLSQEQVTNGLVKRAIEAERLTEEQVSSDGKRDLTKAREALVGLYKKSPRMLEASLEKYLAGKLQKAIEDLKAAKQETERLKSEPEKGEAYEEALAN